MAEIRCQEIRPLWARFSGPVNRLMTYACSRAVPAQPIERVQDLHRLAQQPVPFSPGAPQGRHQRRPQPARGQD